VKDSYLPLLKFINFYNYNSDKSHKLIGVVYRQSDVKVMKAHHYQNYDVVGEVLLYLSDANYCH
jgi:hypothetical protein